MNPAENYILRQDEPFKSIIIQLQIIIEATVPQLDLKYKWHLPYYYRGKKPFCFINVTKKYVDVGFRANDGVNKYDAYLVTEKRKVMKSLRYYQLSDINQEILIAILKEIK